MNAKEADELESCALCGFKFSRNEAACSGCAMNKSCRVICCPNCGYRTVDDTQVKRFVQKCVLFYRNCVQGARCRVHGKDEHQ